MLEIVSTLAKTLQSALDSRQGLVLENLALRHRLAVPTRSDGRPVSARSIASSGSRSGGSGTGRAAWQTVHELIAEAAGDEVRPGMVAAVHTAASDLRWHPQIHAIASRGGWDREGRWHSVASVDTRAAELLFRHKVISLLAARGLLTEDRIELLESWKSGHTGFSARWWCRLGARIGSIPPWTSL